MNVTFYVGIVNLYRLYTHNYANNYIKCLVNIGERIYYANELLLAEMYTLVYCLKLRSVGGINNVIVRIRGVYVFDFMKEKKFG